MIFFCEIALGREKLHKFLKSKVTRLNYLRKIQKRHLYVRSHMAIASTFYEAFKIVASIFIRRAYLFCEFSLASYNSIYYRKLSQYIIKQPFMFLFFFFFDIILFFGKIQVRSSHKKMCCSFKAPLTALQLHHSIQVRCCGLRTLQDKYCIGIIVRRDPEIKDPALKDFTKTMPR